MHRGLIRECAKLGEVGVASPDLDLRGPLLLGGNAGAKTLEGALKGGDPVDGLVETGVLGGCHGGSESERRAGVKHEIKQHGPNRAAIGPTPVAVHMNRGIPSHEVLATLVALIGRP